MLQEPYSRADVFWPAADHVLDSLIARGRVAPHLPPGAPAAAHKAARDAASAAVPDALVPLEVELNLR